MASSQTRTAKKVATALRRPDRRSAQPLLALLLAVLAMIGCTQKHADVMAPLPPVQAQSVPGVETYGADYKVKPGDALRVKFSFHPELDVKVPVAPDGKIHIPTIGDVEVHGRTAEQIAATVEQLSSQQLRDPEVTIIVAEYGSRVVYVTGEVRLPGPVEFREGMTPLQAIVDRGGFTEVAQLDSVLHLTPEGNTYGATRLDFSKKISAGGPEIAALRVYDVIHVPRTFIGDANAFVRLYIRGLMPTMPRIGVAFTP